MLTNLRTSKTSTTQVYSEFIVMHCTEAKSLLSTRNAKAVGFILLEAFMCVWV